MPPIFFEDHLATPVTTVSPYNPPSGGVQVPLQEQPAPMQPVHCIHESDLAVLNQALLEIKDSITSIRDLMTSNAVLEEQVSTLNREMKEVKRGMVEVRLAQARASGSSAWLEKVCWALVDMALGALVGGKMVL